MAKPSRPPAEPMHAPSLQDAGGAVPDPAAVPHAPGILYFDPNPTTARLATAGLRLAGYAVFHASGADAAVELARRHGPGGDGTIAALLLDTATAPKISTEVLRALLQVPGAQELPGILLVSRNNPNPIPGAESLPSLRRPFTTPALLKLLRDALETHPPADPEPEQAVSRAALDRLRLVLAEHFPDLTVDDAQLRSFASDLVVQSELPTPATANALHGHLSAIKLETVLWLLDAAAATGVLQVDDGPTTVRLHLDRGRIRVAEAEGVEEDLRLGRFVVEAGFLSTAEVEAIADASDPQRRPLGQRLVDEGHLRGSELARLLIQQAR
jgi:CheY-like chemotaxis protein